MWHLMFNSSLNNPKAFLHSNPCLCHKIIGNNVARVGSGPIKAISAKVQISFPLTIFFLTISLFSGNALSRWIEFTCLWYRLLLKCHFENPAAGSLSRNGAIHRTQLRAFEQCVKIQHQVKRIFCWN